MHRSFLFWIISIFFLPLLAYPAAAHNMEKLSDEQLREITGQAGFIETEEDLEVLKEARNNFEDLIRSQGLQNFLQEKTRNKLLNDQDLKPEKQAELLERTTRELLMNPDFLKQVEQAGRALAELSKALRQLQSLR